MKITVLGSGTWGCALAQVLADNNQEVYIWGKNENQVNDIQNNHKNTYFFGDDVILNDKIVATTDINIAKGSDVILLCVPTIAIEEVCKKLNNVLDKKVIIINTSKGFHPETNERISNVIRKFIKPEFLSSVVSLIGPSHAEEVVLRMLTTISAVSQNIDDAKQIQKVFSNDYFRVYTGNDEIGSELGVALKNSIAVASGILAGLGYGDNTRAALITRGLAEMIRFGTYFGGKKETFIGLTGVGDLIVTCTSIHSRNFKAGFAIGKANDAKVYWNENKSTCEGIRTTKVVYELANKYNLDMPIISEIYKVLYEGKEPRLSAKDLMLRDLKPEEL